MGKSIGFLVFFLLLNCISYAQEEEGHFFLIQKFRAVMPEGGSSAERDSLLLEWINATDRKNEKIISEKHLRHYYSSDSHDWIVITEYASWEDIDASRDISQELNKKKWPDDKKRREFFRNVFKYFDGHSDEIYQELPKFGK